LFCLDYRVDWFRFFLCPMKGKMKTKKPVPVVSTRLPRDIRQELEAIAVSEGRTLSAVVGLALEQALIEIDKYGFRDWCEMGTRPHRKRGL
jgi:hypothetical protein